MTVKISVPQLRRWLNDGNEIALFDVREHGQYGEGHPFFSVSLPYSRLELDALRLAPNRAVRVVLFDNDDGVAERAARRLAFLGYVNLAILDGGAPAWEAAGHVLFKGVNVPSKTFGELAEHHFHTPGLTAQELRQRVLAGEKIVIVDGRTFEEHRKMSVPGAISLPNGELALRIAGLAGDPATTVVVHCAGRTRSIVGAQILRELGIPNPVFALENGTQGWRLAGFELEHGSMRRATDIVDGAERERLRLVATARAAACRIPTLDADQAQRWLDDAGRTTYLFDIRSPEEFSAGTLAGASSAPGGQLVQATDLYVGVRRSRILLLDDDGIRAPVVASWLWRLGFEVGTVDGGIHAGLQTTKISGIPVTDEALAELDANRLRQWIDAGSALLDLRSSSAFRLQHAAGSIWTIRPNIAPAATITQPVVMIADDSKIAALAAIDLKAAGAHRIAWTRIATFSEIGHAIEASPQVPADADAIDYLFFVHDRHDGNLDAARRYLEWETGLVGQCCPDELAEFRLE